MVYSTSCFAGEQWQPPGFSIHPLPYTDEVRLVAAHRVMPSPAVVPDIPRLRAQPQSVRAAGALIDSMVDDKVTRGTFTSAAGAFGAAVLRAQVCVADAYCGVRCTSVKRI